MSSFINQAVSAIMAALQSAPPVAPSIGRVNLRPIAQASGQAVIIRPVNAAPASVNDFTGQPTSWACAIAVECYARSTGTTAPDQSVDALIETVYARLMTDPTLSGVVINLAPKQINYDFDADGEKTACATLEIHTLQHATNGALS